MKTVKYLLVAAAIVLSPVTYAAETFVSHYEPLRDMKVHAGETRYATVDKNLSRSAALSFDALGRRFDLELTANDRVLAALPAGAVSERVSVYRGRLANNPESWVRIVMFDGMPSGLVWDGETMFAIEAPGNSAVDTSEPVMYRLADLNILPGTMTCGTESIAGNAEQIYTSMKGEWDMAAAQAPGAVSEITVSVIGDASFTNRKGGDAEAVAAISARFNNIDGWFSEQVGIQLRVELIETHSAASDPFSDTRNSGTLLDELSRYRDQTPAHNRYGLTHLYTGRDFETSTVGVAWRGGLCDRFLSAGLSEGRAGEITESLIAAHEIGHNFNAEHDGQSDGSCPNEPETYIMAPSLNGSRQFSACSIAVMQREAASSRCVAALPAVDVGIDRNAPVSTVLLGANTVIEYDVAVNGTLPATDVVADFTLPSVLALESIATSTGRCTSGAGTATCTLGDLSGLSRHTITITTTPVAVGDGTLTASVSTSDADERSSNDQDQVRLTVDPAVDLVVNTPATSPVFVNNSTSVTATLENLTTIAASNVALSVTLDSGLQASAANWSIGTCTVAARQIDCQASSFAARSSSSLSITATATATGMQDVSISISSAEADADPTNNTASRAVNVVTPQSEEENEGGGSTGPLSLLVVALWGLVAGRRRSRIAAH